MATVCEPVTASPLLRLPPEIIHQILIHLESLALVSLIRTCRLLRKHAENELLWADLIRKTLPNPPKSPFPSATFRSLYISHHPYWFLPKHRLWFSDSAYTGKLVLVKYDPRRGSIEGYTLLCSKGESSLQDWSHHPQVVIYSFEPTVTLHRDRPVIKLEHAGPPGQTESHRWWKREVRMWIGSDTYASIFSTLFLSRAVPKQLLDASMELWPPRTIPAEERVRSASQDNFQGWGHKPQKYEEISKRTFRSRTWMQLPIGNSSLGARMGEQVSTWSTLDPALYTPTKEKPYQGIWVGDYAGHGCEFLLVMQRETVHGELYPTQSQPWSRWNLDSPDDEPNMRVVTADTSCGHQALARDDPAFKGRIEAIKLTGDENVPRGEYTWIANDIGPAGFVRVAEEKPFQGARIVKSRGHLADRRFQNDEFVHSQLIMISHDRLAQYWQPLGHVSFYERVDIDALTNSGGTTE